MFTSSYEQLYLRYPYCFTENAKGVFLYIRYITYVSWLPYPVFYLKASVSILERGTCPSLKVENEGQKSPKINFVWHKSLYYYSHVYNNHLVFLEQTPSNLTYGGDVGIIYIPQFFSELHETYIYHATWSLLSWHDFIFNLGQFLWKLGFRNQWDVGKTNLSQILSELNISHHA